MSPSINVHTLRSSTTYVHEDNFVPGSLNLNSTLYKAFRYFQSGSPIPPSLLAKLESFTIGTDIFLGMSKIKELEGGRYIYLEDGKIKFNTFTLPPHAEVLGRVMRQISRQDTMDLFIDGSGGDVPLAGLNVKQPDAHWTINLDALPLPPPPGTFAIGAGGNIAPQLVLEVAVSNETMPQLTQTDLARYFGAGTGTRWWIGIKIFKNPLGTNRWWARHASRRMINSVFQNVADFHPESMPIVATNNVDINIPTNLVFHIDVATLIHPCVVPPNYPATFDIDLENIRRLIVRLL